MKTGFRVLFAAAVVAVGLGVLALLVTPGSRVLRKVDAISLDQFLENKHALYEALNERMQTPPAGIALTPIYQEPGFKPEFDSWPPDDHIRIASTGQYTYETEARFVLDLEQSGFSFDDPGKVQGAAQTLLDYYFEPLAEQGLERNPNGGTIGKTMLVSERWNRRFDPTISVTVTVFIAPASQEAVVTIGIRERLAA